LGNGVYIYALMKSLYDEGSDYLDSFWPLAIRVIPHDNFYSLTSVRKKLNEQLNLELPIHVLSAILAKAEKKNFILKTEDSYRLTPSGNEYVSKLETNKDVERRLNKLCLSIQAFCIAKDVALTEKQIRDMLTLFINKNLDYFAHYINPTVSEQVSPTLPSDSVNERCLLDYFEIIDKQDPDNFKTLEDMVMGSVLFVLLNAQTPEQLENVGQKFNACIAYLDTNFVFSVLGLHAKEFREPAIELYDMLVKNGIQLRIFGFTCEEISIVLNCFSQESDRYPSNLKIDTLYSALKRNQWSQTDVREFIINLEKHLAEKRITVEWVKDTNVKDYSVSEETRNTIKRYKPEQSIFHQNHDLLAIDKIRQIREHPYTKLEDSKAFFLTSDVRLSKFNFDYSHKKTGTITEVIHDRLLTNILWLKNPNTKLSLKSIIAAHSRELFINHHVWNRFYETLKKLKKSGQATDDQIATLFYRNYIEETLLTINPDTITAEFVLEEIEKAQKQKESDFASLRSNLEALKKLGAEKEEEIKSKKEELEKSREELTKEKEFAKKLVQTTADKAKEEAKQEANKEWLKKIESAKGEIRLKAEKRAKLISTLIKVIAIITYLMILVVVIYVYNVPLSIVNLILSASGFGGLIGIWALAGKAKDILYRKIYHQMLDSSKLEELSK
jgi:hypothetical protein